MRKSFFPAAMLHICKDFCYVFPQNFRAVFYSQSFLELLQLSLWLLSGHFQTKLNISGESAGAKTGRILFQDLNSAVAEAEIAVQ